MQIAIIGLGLIGGSLAKAPQKKIQSTPSSALTVTKNTLLDAFLGAIDSVGSTSLLENADVVYVCLYPQMSCASSRKTHRILKKAALSRMCAASKNQVCGKLTEIAKNYPFVYVGGHPMAGKERSGFDASEASLFYNASYILVFRRSSAKRHRYPRDSQKAWALAPSNTARSKSTTV